MFSISEIFYLVFTQLSVGGFILLILIPKDVVGANFYRLMGGIYLLVIALARCANLYLHNQTVNITNFFLYWEDTEAILIIVFFLLLFIYTVSWWFKYPIIRLLIFWIGSIAGGSLIIISTLTYMDQVQFPDAQYILPFQFLVSAALLGIVHTGMWFGHWYLVTPELPVHLLRRYNTALLVVLLVSIVLFFLSMFFRSHTANTVPFNFHFKLIFYMRIGLGFAATLLLYFITWDCLRPKSVERDEVGATRAATGFLFIAIITVLMGEFCSRYLFLTMKYIL
ncbi:hypothetical protein C6497_05920 [Candidatus Poribacteria bacterium]|nr:MAG: hypothetical protein C6497_05920 [Candidatus Poribacteria bacterium]